MDLTDKPTDFAKKGRLFSPDEVRFLFLAYKQDFAAMERDKNRDLEAFQKTKLSLCGYVDATYSLTPKGRMLFGLD